MNWLFLALISVLGVAIANVLRRVLMKGDKTDPYAYTIIFQSLLAILPIPIVIVHGFYFPHLSIYLLFFVIAAVLWGAASFFIFKAVHLLEASEVTIITTTGVVVTIVISVIFLHETFSFQKILGTVITFAAVILVSNLRKGFKVNKGIVFALLATTCAGIAIVLDGINVKNYDVISYGIIIDVLIVFVLFLLRPKALNKWKHLTKPNFLKKMLPLAIFSAIQGFAYLFALKTPGVIAQVSAIRQSSVIITVIIAMIFLNERDNLLKKVIAAILVTIGVVLLS